MPKCEHCKFMEDGAIETSCGTEYDPYCSAGIPEKELVKFADGEYGCRHRMKTLQKKHNENVENYNQYMHDMAIGMALMYQEENEDWKEKAISKIEHALGMDNSGTYKRHGKEYYKPYRNYYCGEDETLDSLVTYGLMETWQSRAEKYYRVTKKGRKWLGEQIDVIIHGED